MLVMTWVETFVRLSVAWRPVASIPALFGVDPAAVCCRIGAVRAGARDVEFVRRWVAGRRAPDRPDRSGGPIIR